MARDTRETLDSKIRELNDAIIELASIVEQAILGSVTALVERDIASAKTIYEGDKIINEKRYEIERQALIIVATQQPMATDLRRLSSIIDIAGELERIGDYAKGIARIAMRLGDQAPLTAAGKYSQNGRDDSGYAAQGDRAHLSPWMRRQEWQSLRKMTRSMCFIIWTIRNCSN